jgi:hypothetical protein
MKLSRNKIMKLLKSKKQSFKQRLVKGKGQLLGKKVKQRSMRRNVVKGKFNRSLRHYVQRGGVKVSFVQSQRLRDNLVVELTDLIEKLDTTTIPPVIDDYNQLLNFLNNYRSTEFEDTEIKKAELKDVIQKLPDGDKIKEEIQKALQKEDKSKRELIKATLENLKVRLFQLADDLNRINLTVTAPTVTVATTPVAAPKTPVIEPTNEQKLNIIKALMLDSSIDTSGVKDFVEKLPDADKISTIKNSLITDISDSPYTVIKTDATTTQKFALLEALKKLLPTTVTPIVTPATTPTITTTVTPVLDAAKKLELLLKFVEIYVTDLKDEIIAYLSKTPTPALPEDSLIKDVLTDDLNAVLQLGINENKKNLLIGALRSLLTTTATTGSTTTTTVVAPVTTTTGTGAPLVTTGTGAPLLATPTTTPITPLAPILPLATTAAPLATTAAPLAPITPNPGCSEANPKDIIVRLSLERGQVLGADISGQYGNNTPEALALLAQGLGSHVNVGPAGALVSAGPLPSTTLPSTTLPSTTLPSTTLPSTTTLGTPLVPSTLPGTFPGTLGAATPLATTTNPLAPTPLAPTPLAPTPLAPTPLAPTPLAPPSLAPPSLAPTPFAPPPPFVQVVNKERQIFQNPVIGKYKTVRTNGVTLKEIENVLEIMPLDEDGKGTDERIFIDDADLSEADREEAFSDRKPGTKNKFSNFQNDNYNFQGPAQIVNQRDGYENYYVFTTTDDKKFIVPVEYKNNVIGYDLNKVKSPDSKVKLGGALRKSKDEKDQTESSSSESSSSESSSGSDSSTSGSSSSSSSDSDDDEPILLRKKKFTKKIKGGDITIHLRIGSAHDPLTYDSKLPIQQFYVFQDLDDNKLVVHITDYQARKIAINEVTEQEVFDIENPTPVEPLTVAPLTVAAAPPKKKFSFFKKKPAVPALVGTAPAALVGTAALGPVPGKYYNISGYFQYFKCIQSKDSFAYYFTVPKFSTDNSGNPIKILQPEPLFIDGLADVKTFIKTQQGNFIVNESELIPGVGYQYADEKETGYVNAPGFINKWESVGHFQGHSEGYRYTKSKVQEALREKIAADQEKLATLKAEKEEADRDTKAKLEQAQADAKDKETELAKAKQKLEDEKKQAKKEEHDRKKAAADKKVEDDAAAKKVKNAQELAILTKKQEGEQERLRLKNEKVLTISIDKIASSNAQMVIKEKELEISKSKVQEVLAMKESKSLEKEIAQLQADLGKSQLELQKEINKGEEAAKKSSTVEEVSFENPMYTQEPYHTIETQPIEGVTKADADKMGTYVEVVEPSRKPEFGKRPPPFEDTAQKIEEAKRPNPSLLSRIKKAITPRNRSNESFELTNFSDKGTAPLLKNEASSAVQESSLNILSPASNPGFKPADSNPAGSNPGFNPGAKGGTYRRKKVNKKKKNRTLKKMVKRTKK